MYRSVDQAISCRQSHVTLKFPMTEFSHERLYEFIVIPGYRKTDHTRHKCQSPTKFSKINASSLERAFFYQKLLKENSTLCQRFVSFSQNFDVSINLGNSVSKMAAETPGKSSRSMSGNTENN
uniref:AsIV-cont00086-ORF2 n=1 Tax=Apophua simplicipes ichnovirus TaxID=1329648 RepID=S5DMM6_9VIRU|nr:AsIV-cont00086-ORF2 [Apophua simplicipes ichnovirus]